MECAVECGVDCDMECDMECDVDCGIDRLTVVTQVLQCHEVFLLAEAIEPSSAERQRTKVLVDDIE